MSEFELGYQVYVVVCLLNCKYATHVLSCVVRSEMSSDDNRSLAPRVVMLPMPFDMSRGNTQMRPATQVTREAIPTSAMRTGSRDDTRAKSLGDKHGTCETQHMTQRQQTTTKPIHTSNTYQNEPNIQSTKHTTQRQHTTQTNARRALYPRSPFSRRADHASGGGDDACQRGRICVYLYVYIYIYIYIHTGTHTQIDWYTQGAATIPAASPWATQQTNVYIKHCQHEISLGNPAKLHFLVGWLYNC